MQSFLFWHDLDRLSIVGGAVILGSLSLLAIDSSLNEAPKEELLFISPQMNFWLSLSKEMKYWKVNVGWTIIRSKLKVVKGAQCWLYRRE